MAEIKLKSALTPTGLFPALNPLYGIQQPPAESDYGQVGRYQVFLGAIGNRPHRSGNHGIFHSNAPKTGPIVIHRATALTMKIYAREEKFLRALAIQIRSVKSRSHQPSLASHWLTPV